MHKRILPVLLTLVLAFSLSCCGSPDVGGVEKEDAFIALDKAIDIDFAKSVIEKVSSFGDDPVMGMRSAGSPAETEAAYYLADVMKEIGLKNVTVDEATVDGWTFKGANITFTNAEGKEQKIHLGGYQTTLQADNEECELVYVNRGTEADYEGIDVKDKLVLIDIDQNEEWWITFPAYQAKVKGAKAVIAMSIFPEDGLDRVGVQDICGPADAPALAISEQDSKALQEAIKASGKGSIKVILNADSQVTENATTHNVWGEIPGKTDETIFVFAHIDGYFHSQYDDAHGIGVSLAIAKAMIDSGYQPEKTIRFCMHGAEEWGVSGSEYDWSKGAYEEIMTVHPEWVEGAFAIVNNDGGYCVQGETYMGVRSSTELIPFVKESVGELSGESKYEWSFDTVSTYTEDFQWTLLGIPSIVAAEGEGVNYHNMGYHSTYDSWDAQPLDEEGFRESIRTFGKIVIDLDKRAVRPMNFTARLQEFEESLYDPSGFEALLEKGYAAAAALEEKMAAVEAEGNREAAIELNKRTQEVYKAFQDALVGLSFEPEAIIKHELYQGNVEALDNTIAALEEGNIQEAYDEYLWAIDWAWYYMNFDEETCRYLEDQLFNNRKGTWGDGLIKYRHCDIDSVVRSLGAKYDDESADVSSEIAKLKELRAIEQDRLEKTLAEERAGLEKAIQLMEKYSKAS